MAMDMVTVMDSTKGMGTMKSRYCLFPPSLSTYAKSSADNELWRIHVEVLNRGFTFYS